MNSASIFQSANSQAAAAAHTPTPNFDRLAHLYRWMEFVTFGPWLECCRSAFLARLADCRRALVLGDGDGRFTARQLRANPQVEIDAVDLSPAMLRALARRAGPHAARVHAHCADARDWQPADSQYDLVITHFFLDCLSTEEIRSMAERLRAAVSSSGLWVVSEFAIPEGRFGRFVARRVVWLLYRAFALLTGLKIRSLPDHHAALRDAGFSLVQRRAWLRGLLVSEIWSAN